MPDRGPGAAGERGVAQQQHHEHQQQHQQPGDSEVNIHPEHATDLRRSALTDQHIQLLLQGSPSGGQPLRSDEHTKPDQAAPRLFFPYWKPDGSPETIRGGRAFIRWKNYPSAGQPGGPRYLSPKDEGCRIYHSHIAIHQGDYEKRLSNTSTKLRITEGEKKTECATVHDPKTITIGLGGVNSWVDRRAPAMGEDGKPEATGPLPELEAIPVTGRQVELVFDSDLHKPQVRAALLGLSIYLAGRGAIVSVVVLPNGADHTPEKPDRLGLDDLICRHGADLFRSLCELSVPALKPGSKIPTLGFPVPYEPQVIYKALVAAAILLPTWRSARSPKADWFRWIGTHWTPVTGSDDIDADLERLFDSQGWRNRDESHVRSIRSSLRRRLNIAYPKDPGPLEPGLVPFSNGVYDIRAQMLMSHCPKQGGTWALAIPYDPASDSKPIEDFLLDRLKEPAVVQRFRAAGCALLAQLPIKAFIEITGAADSGKSLLATLLMALVGHGNFSAGKLDLLESKSARFETDRLVGKRLAVFSECHTYKGEAPVLKTLTSGGADPVRSERKNSSDATDFVFRGLVVLVGNSPVLFTESGRAVRNRRRALRCPDPVPVARQRRLLEDANGSWIGELVPYLPGFAIWCLNMGAEQARLALSSAGGDESTAVADLQQVLESDPLAEWVDSALVLDELAKARVGTETDSADQYLYANYRENASVDADDWSSRPIPSTQFKKVLVSLLRQFDAPIPPGDVKRGPYRERGVGSVIPGIRLRGVGDDHIEGVLTQLAKVRPISSALGAGDSPLPPKNAEGLRKSFISQAPAQTPSGNGFFLSGTGKGMDRTQWGTEGTGGTGRQTAPTGEQNAISGKEPLKGEVHAKPVPPAPSVPCKGFARSAPVPDSAGPVPVPPSLPTSALLHRLMCSPGTGNTSPPRLLGLAVTAWATTTMRSWLRLPPLRQAHLMPSWPRR